MDLPAFLWTMIGVTAPLAGWCYSEKRKGKEGKRTAGPGAEDCVGVTQGGICLDPPELGRFSLARMAAVPGHGRDTGVDVSLCPLWKLAGIRGSS